jgi:peptide deformylase
MAVDPKSLELRIYPDAALRKRAAPIAEVTDEVRAVATEMIRIMREEEGVGLAAPQVGLSWRMFVADVPPDDKRSAQADPPTATKGPVVYVNPVIVEPEGAIEPFEEGCLSLPDIRGEVLRPPVVSIAALGLDGKRFTARAGGLLARCWQHEVDHLDGVLIIDKMTQLSRIKNRKAIRDLERE